MPVGETYNLVVMVWYNYKAVWRRELASTGPAICLGRKSQSKKVGPCLLLPVLFSAIHTRPHTQS